MLKMIKDKHYARARRIYQTVGVSPFTTSLAATILDIEPARSLVGTMKHLHENDVIEITNGEKRAHYRNKEGVTVWRFTGPFINHMQETDQG
jgi:hypothetical protein